MSEPSMEDILASIRRIIAADQTGAPIRNFTPPVQADAALVPAIDEAPRVGDAGSPSAAPELAAEASAHDTWAVPGSPPRYLHLHDVDDLVSTAPAVDPPVVRMTEQTPDVARRADDHLERAEMRDSLYPTAEDEAAVSGHYDLQDTDAVDPSFVVEPLLSSTAGASISSSFQALAQTVLFNDPDMIERVARDALRPMLRAWLDENLPSMVERLVRTEIERVARGGRSRD